MVLFNFGEENFVVNMGDRVAQLIFEKRKSPVIKELDVLEGTGRGVKGYGSIGDGVVQVDQQAAQDPSSTNEESRSEMMPKKMNDDVNKRTPLS